MNQPIVKTGSYKIEDLEQINEIQPLEFVLKTSLKRLNYLVGFILRNNSSILQKFVERLERRLEVLNSADYVSERIHELALVYSDLPYLREYPKLIASHLNYFLSLLKIDNDARWTSERFGISNRNYIPSFLNFRYINAQILTEIMERDSAVKMFKKYIDEYVKESRNLEGEKPETLEDFRNNVINRMSESDVVGWEIVHGSVQNGKFPQRKNTCMWKDAIDDLPDVELKYLADCYGDFQGYNNSNENFVLTMEHTIVEGDSYCSCVLHDTRLSDMKHLSKDFFDKLY